MTQSHWHRVWITGASSGIGRAVAEATAHCADRVWISARSMDSLEEMATRSDAMVARPLDITDTSAVRSAVAHMEAAGGVDLAILNAGAWTLMDADSIDLDAVRTGVEVNILGTMTCVDALLPGMIERGRGHIAIVASVAGYRGLPRSIAYGPTKAALINIAEILRSELQPRGVDVTLVCPGFVDTPMTRGNPFPMPEIVAADEAASAIVDGLMRNKRFEIRFPWRFTTAMKLLRIIPYGAFFAIMRRMMGYPPPGRRNR